MAIYRDRLGSLMSSGVALEFCAPGYQHKLLTKAAVSRSLSSLEEELASMRDLLVLALS